MQGVKMTVAELRVAVKAVKQHGTISGAARALGVGRSWMTDRINAARARWPGCLPDPIPGQHRAWAAKPGGAGDAAAQDIAARRTRDEMERLRARAKALEAQVIAHQNWQAKVDRLHAADVRPASWPKPRPPSKKNILTPILFTSDFQVGEVVRAAEIENINEYNSDIFAQRYQTMIEKTIMLAERNTGATGFNGIIYLRGGDAISGEIHEELAETNDLSAIPAVRLLQQQERAGIRRLKEKFGRVRVISIPGNHGRTTKKSHAKRYAERNFETMLSWWLASSFESDPNVTFWTPASGEAYFEADGWNFLLSHGDRMGSRGGQGFIGPAATIGRGHRQLQNNWARTGRPVDLVLTGHLHTSLKLEMGYANGALAGYNEYARDLRAIPDAAKQWLLFAHPQEMISHAFELRLSPMPRRALMDPHAAVR